MIPKEKVSLCSACGSCPEVEIYDNEVRIGEEGNMVTLRIEEWNALVEKIEKGELRKL